jgi:DNA-binding transcriptional MocR family regulator
MRKFGRQVARRGCVAREVAQRWLATSVSEPPLAQRAQKYAASAGGAASVWQRLNALALRPGMLNMSQGFPDFEGSAIARKAAGKALEGGPVNQYSPQPGYESLRREVASFYGRRYGVRGRACTGMCVCTFM